MYILSCGAYECKEKNVTIYFMAPHFPTKHIYNINYLYLHLITMKISKLIRLYVYMYTYVCVSICGCAKSHRECTIAKMLPSHTPSPPPHPLPPHHFTPQPSPSPWTLLAMHLIKTNV